MTGEFPEVRYADSDGVSIKDGVDVTHDRHAVLADE